MGTPDFAIPSLRALIESPDDVVAVITQPDRAKGRHGDISPPPVKVLAQQNNIPVYQPEKVKNKGFLPQLKALNPDVIVVVAYGQILSREILDIPPKWCINIHASLLPKYRGSAPINWALINGEKVTGVTSMIVSEALDSGPILLKKDVAIEEDDDVKTLHDKLSKAGGELLSETMNGIRKGDLTPVPQNESEATYFPMLEKSDGLIDWHKKAEEIRNRIRGLNQWPGTYTYLSGAMLKIFKADIISGQWPVVGGQAYQPGTILDISDKGIVIATGEGYLSIKELQLEGKRRMTVAEFVRGHKIEKGMVLGS
ncbi:MAG: Methionyl-tRNA formyltransferase [Deltaproteobacteria bacterium]|nr:Methionyl-tRNA formyltransferase [Deltaproteobacteria bacterium]MBM2837946.1 Methionyl-tRNA formyltransferase [Deltaproteobacteria bacterium]